ncbi:alpha-tocopherol transfer protein-like [Haemaphysalis longicornis]
MRPEGEGSDAVELSGELAEVARRELGETPETRRAALAQLRRLIEDEPFLHCPVDDAFLLTFLRVRKFKVNKSFESIKTFCRLLTDNPEVFDNLDPFNVPFDAVCRQSKQFTLSRKTDPEGRPVFLSKEGAWNHDICSLNERFRMGAILYQYMLLKEEAQIRGVVIVADMSGFGSYHLLHYTPSYVKKLVHFMQDIGNMRIKKVYVINTPALFDIIMAIAKPFIKPKLLERACFLGSDTEKLRELIPDDLIPEALGGTFESYDYDELEKDLQSKAAHFKMMNLCRYHEKETADL